MKSYNVWSSAFGFFLFFTALDARNTTGNVREEKLFLYLSKILLAYLLINTLTGEKTN